jgi:hypothetical protein
MPISFNDYPSIEPARQDVPATASGRSLTR